MSEKYKDTDNDNYKNARKFYRDAREAYKAWVEYVREATLAGKEKKLKKDTEYAKIRKDAHDSSEMFLIFAVKGQ